MTERPLVPRLSKRLDDPDVIAYTQHRCPLNAQLYAKRTGGQPTANRAGVSCVVSLNDCAVLLNKVFEAPPTHTANQEEEK